MWTGAHGRSKEIPDMISDAFQESGFNEFKESPVFEREQNPLSCPMSGYANMTNSYRRYVEWLWHYGPFDGGGVFIGDGTPFIYERRIRPYVGETSTILRSPLDSLYPANVSIPFTDVILSHFNQVRTGDQYGFLTAFTSGSSTALGIGYLPHIGFSSPEPGMPFGSWVVTVDVLPIIQLSGHVEILLIRGGRTGVTAFDEWIDGSGNAHPFSGGYDSDPDLNSKITASFSGLSPNSAQQFVVEFQSAQDFCNPLLLVLVRSFLTADYAALLAATPLTDTEAIRIFFNVKRHEAFTVFFIWNNTGFVTIPGFLDLVSGTSSHFPSPTDFQFTDVTIANNGKAAWLWNFGDGQQSTLQNPNHDYTNVGQYNVSLQVTDANGYSFSHTIVVTVTPFVQALFVWNFSNPPGPVRTVHFTNYSGVAPLNLPVTYKWESPNNNASVRDPADATYQTSLGSVVMKLTVTAGGVSKIYEATINL